MTDRYHSLTIVLERNIRDDDAKSLIEAIKHLRGVLSVEGNVSNMDEFVAMERIRMELGGKILDVIYPERIKRRLEQG